LELNSVGQILFQTALIWISLIAVSAAFVALEIWSRPTHMIAYINTYNYGGALVAWWWPRGGALVQSIAFNRRVVGSTLQLKPSRRDLGQVLNSQLPVALRRETPAQHP